MWKCYAQDSIASDPTAELEELFSICCKEVSVRVVAMFGTWPRSSSASFQAFSSARRRRPFQFHEDFSFSHPAQTCLPFVGIVTFRICIDIKRRSRYIEVNHIPALRRRTRIVVVTRRLFP